MRLMYIIMLQHTEEEAHSKVVARGIDGALEAYRKYYSHR